MAEQGFGVRLERAILHAQSQIGRRLGYKEIGNLVAKAEKRRKAYSTTAVSEWANGRSEPKLGTVRALAAVLGVPVTWLAFGEGDSPVGETSHVPAAKIGHGISVSALSGGKEKPRAAK